MSNLHSFPPDVLVTLPDDLPAPEDDGGCKHLIGAAVPNVDLRSTRGTTINFAQMPGLVVLYCYPMTGRPGRAVPMGWVDIPGAAGCTPQACAFRDSHAAIESFGAKVFGMSAQSTADQIEAATRLKLPYELIADEHLFFAEKLGLPVFEAGGMRLLKRVTLIIQNGIVEKYFYPVFPPDKNAEDVLSWLASHVDRPVPE